jgi:hypothetical protein
MRIEAAPSGSRPTVQLFMGRLEDRVLNHPLREHIATLRGHVAELSDDEVAAADEVSEGAVQRVPKALAFIEGVLAATDPELTTASSLEAIGSALTNATTAASQLKDNPQVAATLDQHIEEALFAAGPLAVSSPLIAERADAAVGAFDNALSETVKGVSDRSAALGEELDALEARRTEAVAGLEADEEARRATFTTAMDELTANVNAERARVDQLVPTLQTQFDTAQEQHKQTFDTLREELKTASETTTTELAAEAEKTREALANPDFAATSSGPEDRGR